MVARLRHFLPGTLAIAVVAVLAVMMTFPRTSQADRDGLAAHYRFTAQAISTQHWSGVPLRKVEPALYGIRSWMSSVGAGVALSDVDGDGRSNDVCLVDPRFDTVSLAPAPGTGDRYPRQILDPTGIPFDARTTAPTGCVPGDFNEDGFTDLLVHYWGRSPVLFLRHADMSLRDPGAFVARDLISPPQIWNTDAASLADVDGDGHVDIIVGNYFPDGARLLDPTARRDNALQLQASMSRAFNGGVDHVLLWSAARTGADPTARFRAVAGVLPDHVARGWTLAIGAEDLNRDGLPELYFAHDFGPDTLMVNHSRPGHPVFAEAQGTRGFTTPKSKVIGKDSFKSMGVAFPDLNRDALPDILVSNITSDYALHESNEVWLSTGRTGQLDHGVAPYQDNSEALGLSRSGWAWDIKAADFDNDGRDEIVQAVGFLRGQANRWGQLQQFAISNDLVLPHEQLWPEFGPGTDLSGHERNPFFARSTDGARFVDVSPELGLPQPGVSRSIATADVDGDGRLDYAVANQWAPSYLMRNTASPTNGYLGLRLRLPVPGGGSGTMPALGASLRLVRADGRVLTDQVYPANGHAGTSAAESLFGLGQRPGPSKVEIRWRDGKGVMHSANRSVGPGWHTLLLTPAGGIEEHGR